LAPGEVEATVSKLVVDVVVVVAVVVAGVVVVDAVVVVVDAVEVATIVVAILAPGEVEATASKLVVDIFVVVVIDVVEVDDVVTADPVWASAIFKMAAFLCVTGWTCWATNGKGLSINSTICIPEQQHAVMRS